MYKFSFRFTRVKQSPNFYQRPISRSKRVVENSLDYIADQRIANTHRYRLSQGAYAM